MSRWKEIWEKRTNRLDQIDRNNSKEVFLELKRIDGFDVNSEEGLSFEALNSQHTHIMNMLSARRPIQSIFEVGCGSGADLYMYQQKGLEVGGIDYSAKQIEVVKQVFGNRIKECICSGADCLPTEHRYDAVVSNSVFSYFDSEEYAEKVLRSMLEKARYSVGIIDIHNLDKKDAYVEYRRKMIKDYDERYKDLQKRFYTFSFFQKIAESNGYEIVIDNEAVEGYWNNDFVFHCYMYRVEDHK